jgi:hypothetical protein
MLILTKRKSIFMFLFEEMDSSTVLSILPKMIDIGSRKDFFSFRVGFEHFFANLGSWKGLFRMRQYKCYQLHR